MAARSSFGNENLNFLRIFQVSGFLPIKLKNEFLDTILDFCPFCVLFILFGLSVLRYFFVDVHGIMDSFYYFDIFLIFSVIFVASMKKNQQKSVLR